MINTEIDYLLVHSAIAYYAQNFKYIEVPWIVSAQALNATCPKDGTKRVAPDFVASGEQSFLDLVLQGKLTPGRYCCATPCFRPWDSGRSENHFSQFFKVELIHFTGDETPKFSDYEFLRNTAFKFMSLYTSVQLSAEMDDARMECETLYSEDIVSKNLLELGSYGARRHPKIGNWIYGTGAALPRLQTVIDG